MSLRSSKLRIGTTKGTPAGAAAVLALCLFAAACPNTREQAGIPANRTIAASELPDGIVAYQQGECIFVKSLAVNAQPVRLAEKGSFPRFSPDGTHVAFVSGKSIMLLPIAGGEPQTLATAGDPRAVVFHPDGRQVLFSDGDSVKSVSISGGAVTAVAEGYRFRELDISGDGALLAATVRGMGVGIRIFDLKNGGSRKLAAGCAVSFSPDGRLVTCNSGDHRKLNLLDQSTGRIAGFVSAPEGLKFDNHFWSNNADWLVSVSEGESADIFVHNVPSNLNCRVTSSGNCDRPDLFVYGDNRL